jgi:hypothetical protein
VYWNGLPNEPVDAAMRGVTTGEGDGNSEQRNVPDPNGTLTLQPSSHWRISPPVMTLNVGMNQHESFCDGMKDHIE